MEKLQAQAVKEISWCDHLTRHAASGKSIAAFCRAEDISQANFYAWSRKLRGDVNGLTIPSADCAFIDLGAVSGPVADHSTGHVPKPAMATATSAPTLRAIVNPGIAVRIDLGGGLYAIPCPRRHAGNSYAETTKAWLGARPSKDSGVPLATTVVQAPA